MSIPSTPRLTSIAAATLLAALPALAQEAAPEAPAEDAAQPAEAAAPAEAAEAPAAGDATTEAGEALGQPYVAEVTGDWQIECIRTTLEADPCRMVQMLLDQGNPAVRTELVALPEGGPAPAVATFYTPLETLLSEQLTLSVDGGRKSKHMFNYCTPQFCVAQVPFAPDAVEAFKRGNKAEAIIVPLRAPGQQVQLSMSLAGFTAGYNRLTELSAASTEAIRKAQAQQQQQQQQQPAQSGGN
ncbi:invasion associated locus B family protein [Tropicimonas sp. IMCC6043]|uniref:invasion associated locus B family protein n=1 Tax=Tropicimonas sp. IMCC6043 TaxID=2510645 RepID=UPI00101C7774|nr:invasion associated locus B family protein [Tropicimonas sp. IMCC6043]RYH12063.1 invasion associated locus B family protein [Tropicimonas sp. IMCC6043]